MIRFHLVCERGHGFEAWFGSNGDFDEQRERGLVECVRCGSTAVEKALMAPAVSTARRREARVDARRPDAAPRDVSAGTSGSMPSRPAGPPAVAPGAQGAREAAREAALRHAMRRVAEVVRRNTVDVGAAFPEEARRIHYGEAPERGIRGRASPDEVRSLVEEGVGIAPVPVSPDDAN